MKKTSLNPALQNYEFLNTKDGSGSLNYWEAWPVASGQTETAIKAGLSTKIIAAFLPRGNRNRWFSKDDRQTIEGFDANDYFFIRPINDVTHGDYSFQGAVFFFDGITVQDLEKKFGFRVGVTPGQSHHKGQSGKDR